jgi:hypothetical protein
MRGHETKALMFVAVVFALFAAPRTGGSWAW